ncbi:MAG: TrkA family potassium uptake protein [Nitrospirae bacterium]|nr:TrkA family potassium uptake protein [Nitrospirota bacterium]
MKVIIIGGGKIGDFLSKALLYNKHQVTIIEEESERCNCLVKSLNTVVINGDGTSLQTLTDAEAQNADVLVALTGRDQDNLVACQLAHHHFKVPRTIARVGNPQNRELFQKLGGVNTTVCTTEIISSLVEEKVSLKDMITLLTFEEGEVVIVETEVGEDSPARGQKIMELNLPQECVIISVFRESHMIFPHGETILKMKDKVLALTTAQKKSVLQEMI